MVFFLNLYYRLFRLHPFPAQNRHKLYFRSYYYILTVYYKYNPPSGTIDIDTHSARVNIEIISFFVIIIEFSFIYLMAYTYERECITKKKKRF